MNEHLRPSTLGEILDRTVSLYRRRFLMYLGIAAVPAALVLLFGGLLIILVAWSSTTSPDAGVVIGLIGLALVLIAAPLAIGANALSAAALCHAAGTHLMGESSSVRGAYKAVWKRFWSYVGLYLLQVLIIGVAPLVLWSMIVGMMAAGILLATRGAGGSVIAIGVVEVVTFLGFLVYAILMLLKLCLAFPASVAEGATVGGAFKRAWNLSKGTKGRIFVMFLMGVILTWLLSGILMMLVAFAFDFIPALSSLKHSQAATNITLIAMYAAGFAVQALTKPIYGIALVLFYYDQRVRQEAFDVEELMRRAGMVATPEADERAPWLPAPTAIPEPAAIEAAPAPTPTESEHAGGTL